MSTNMLSPGVQITLLDYSDYVRDASTSTVGMVGGARRGPLGPTYVTTREQALTLFGNPTTKDYGIYSLLAVLEKGDKVYYNRIAKAPSKASAGNDDADKLTFYSLTESSLMNGSKIESKEEAATVVGAAPTFEITLTTNDGTIETFSGILEDGSNAKEKINGASAYVTVEVNPDTDVKVKAGTRSFSGGAKGYSLASTPESDQINFVSKYYDSTMNGWTVTLSEPNFLNEFTYTLKNRKGEVIETINGLIYDDDTDDKYFETFVNKNSDYLQVSFDKSASTEVLGKEYEFSGGADGIEGLDEGDAIEGLDGFSNPEVTDIDILCAPGWSAAAVISQGIKVCETRQECLYLIDPPFGLTVQQVVNWSNCQGEYSRPDSSIYNTSYAAIYWPWVQIYDTFTKSYIWLPPSGYVAAQIVYSDSVAEPWFAPAGINRGLMTPVVNIEVSPTQGERDLLYGNTNVVNPIINFKQNGIVIWGQKTTQRKATALDRVNVRRLVNYLKKIVTQSTYYYVFDPNDSYLWQKWVDMVSNKLSAIQSKRGVYEYKVIMDETTVTPDDIENNRMPGTIKFKPTKTAEFIPLNFMIMPYTASFDEGL